MPPADSLATCAEHGLKYDPRQHSGCVVCRRGEAPARPRRTRLVVALLVVVAGIALAYVALYRFVRGRVVATAKSEESARDARQTPIAVAPVAAPSALPLIGPEGTDADGYPTQYVDQAALRALLARRRFAELTAYVEKLEADFEADPKRELWAHDAVDAFHSADATLLEPLDEWANAHPQSFAPYVARAQHWITVAYARRGGKWASETPASNFTAMEDATGRAWKDLEHALSLHPKLVTARCAQMSILRAGSNDKALEQSFDAAMAACPTCFVARTERMVALFPRWGGSYAAMDAFARASTTPANPRTRLLAGYVDYERARTLREKKDFAGALAAIERALAVGDHWLFLSERAEIESQRGDTKAALADLDRAVALRPGAVGLRFDRAWAYAALRQWEPAGRDLLAGLRVDPTSTIGRAAHASVVKGLIFDGWEAHTAGRNEDALRLYDLAADLDPPNDELRWRRNEIVSGNSAGGPSGIEALEENAREHPDDFALHQKLDYAYARQRQFERVVAMWTEFLARNPNDGRAYLERGGAYFNMRRMSEAHADASKACALGVADGCARAKQVAAMPK